MDFLVKAAEAAEYAVEQTGLHAISVYTWLYVIGISCLGGAASFYRNLKSEKTRPFNIAELLGELCISAFVGLLTMLAGTAAGISELWVGVFCGITGHMGSRAIMLGENMLTAWAQSKAQANANAAPSAAPNGNNPQP